MKRFHLLELIQKFRSVLPPKLPFLPDDWGYPQVVTVRGLVMPAYRCLPLRALPDGRKPVVTSGHKSRNRSRPTHYGADMFYQYNPQKDPPMKIGDGGRTKKWWIPQGTLVIAQADGEVVVGGNSKTGWRVWIRHEGGLHTGGFHMKEIYQKVGEAVNMGEDLGPVGDNPSVDDPAHLHTELYNGPIKNYPKGTLDPEIFWIGAQTLPAHGAERPTEPKRTT